MALKSICGVIIAAHDPGSLAAFYSEVFGVASFFLADPDGNTILVDQHR